MNAILENLNEEQIKPVMDTEGAVLVLAGAGSGKTRVLTSRIAYILSEGKCDLSGILAITFTNKAAGEMKDRLENLFGTGESKWICTIHSMCVKILREFGDKIGIRPNFSIYSETERNNVIKKVCKELDYDENMLKRAKYHIAKGKMLGLNPELYGKRFSYERGIDDIVNIFGKYCDRLIENNALDFDDLLTETLRLLRFDDETREYLSDKFKYIHVDEFQDTNAVQYSIIKLLAQKHGNIFVVGDDDQSIYGWRGAEIDNILKFDKDFSDARVYKLERNYRSTKNILQLANSIIKHNSMRRGKTLWTDAEEGAKPVYYQAEEETGEALFAVRKILDGVASGRSYSDYAVLMRINALTRPYEQEFAKYNIPFKVFGGFRFFERKEIKDLMAYLRLVSNPFDNEALERIINVPRRGIGAKTVEAMYRYAARTGLTLYDACVDGDVTDVPEAMMYKLKAFGKIIKKLVVSSINDSVAELVRNVIKFTDLRSAYDDGTEEGDGKLANLDEFISSADEFTRLNPDGGIDEFLNQISLSSDTDDMDDGDYVSIATIHSVKGLEFPCVIICGLEEKIMPSPRAEEDGRDFEEERRLMYVAITRAKQELYLTRSKSRFLYGHREITAPSQFIKELSKELGLKDDRKFYQKRYDYYYDDESGYESDVPASGGGGIKFSAPLCSSARGNNPNGNTYEVGQRVLHKKFGFGTIIAMRGNGAILLVAFDRQGTKELSSYLAPLEILS